MCHCIEEFILKRLPDLRYLKVLKYLTILYKFLQYIKKGFAKGNESFTNKSRVADKSLLIEENNCKLDERVEFLTF